MLSNIYGQHIFSRSHSLIQATKPASPEVSSSNLPVAISDLKKSIEAVESDDAQGVALVD